mmetsp:Transcript_16156/g.56370  ORF Transcript_16156/g.56370 Transcript_16156/m.56370 type:complete len:424 (-) Transcript_16156:1283-2554(-)
MASMLRDVKGKGSSQVNVDALKSEIRTALINQKANACPIALRLAWHAAGTFDKSGGGGIPGGCQGATMRFEPESTDPDNAGLGIVRDLLLEIKTAHPEISYADLWACAGCAGVEFLGGPKIPFNFGRTDFPDGKRCPANGRLPDASQGAEHLRQVFGRMGFNDQEIVALSGAHTLGRCHLVRSGFDGPWTNKPLQFDNVYFINLLSRDWVPKTTEMGNKQFEDKQTRTLMMLPTDIALITDAKFKPWVELYARDQERFFRDFANVFAKLIALGCPPECDPFRLPERPTGRDAASAEFRELAMHGSVEPARRVAAEADVHALEGTSGRSALHKAAFWGHKLMVTYLVDECKLNVDAQDHYGDTALHDAARFGHGEVVDILLRAGANASIKNAKGEDAATIARVHGYHKAAAAIARAAGAPRSRL